jgi:hypothetical protein
VTTRHAPINRTGYAAPRRASGWEGIHTDTVPSDPSAARNAEGARLPTGPRSCFVRGHRDRATRLRGDRLATPYFSAPCAQYSHAVHRPGRCRVSTPTSVYRYLDADGVLIYVGITNRGVQRQAEHVAHSKWWRFVHSQDVEHYDDRETAERRERYLIEKHQSPFNVAHNADHKRRLAAYLKHAEVSWQRCGHCEGCQLTADDNYPYEEDCNWWWADDPDEEPSLCKVCGSARCVYTAGHGDGETAGWRTGFDKGEEYAWQQAHAQYTPAYLAEATVRMVVDGWPSTQTGETVSLGIWEAEKALRALQADIDEHGVAALVEKAAEVPF